ncbi:MAG: Cof-type HAD-IIB family hydrolase [Clostridia bacterium]|nr:Cof-type HAD-IIB family hydrolase [Clostridia bacterium]
MIKLLAVDMDGTCLNSKSRMSEATVEALISAAESGITVVPTTGRNLTCLPHRIKNEMFYRYAITSNGAGVVDLRENKRLFDLHIPCNTATALLDECVGKGLATAAHINEDYYVQGKAFTLVGKILYGKDADYSICVKNISEHLKINKSSVEELQFYFVHPKSKERINRILANYPDLSYAFGSIYVEVFAKGTSKGIALSELARILGIEKNEIACIGDGENDMSMFDASGTKFAMGNAVGILKEKADYILPTNNDDGVAYAINNYILNNR